MKALIDFDDAPVFGIPLTDGVGGAVVREGMLIEGPQGWGEFSPHPDCDAASLARWLTSAIEGGTVGWPDPVRGRVPIAVVVPAVTAARAHQIVAASGCRTADVEVAAGTLADDVARVEAVRAALGPGGAIRCDAGGRWSGAAAGTAIAELASAAGELEFVTQPCRTLAELAALRPGVDVRIAVDPSLSGGDHPPAASLVDVADVVVLRSGPLGGVRRALRVAEASELPCVVSSSVETSVGVTSGLALAGVLPELPFACGLGTTTLLTGDLVAAQRSRVPVDGYLPVAPTPPSPDQRLLAEYALADPARIAWWRARLEAVRASR